MFTVNIDTLKGDDLICRQTLEATYVRQTYEGYNEPGEPLKTTPGILIGLDGSGERHTSYTKDSRGGDPDVWFRFFVMNEAGKTVSSYIL